MFTDGSCFKHGPITWHRAGWSVVKMSEDGVLLGWAAGRVGQQLPQTSPAGEHVAFLATTSLSAAVTEVCTDYQGLTGVQEVTTATLCHRKAVYSGVRRTIRGKAPPRMKVRKVKAHVSVSECSTAGELRDKLGNDAADRMAKYGAMQGTGPSQHELEEWDRERRFVHKFLLYCPIALSQWPAVNPTAGHKSLPKREGYSRDNERPIGFLEDALGPLLQRTEPAQAAPTLSRQERAPTSAEDAPTQKHEWHWQAGRWICTACLATSRLAVPPRLSKCAGMSPNLASLVRNPRRHKLHIATFTDGKGVAVVCSRCGHYATSNRPAELHKKDCKAVGGQATFASPGAEST